mgnify:CR=1 FL=1
MIAKVYDRDFMYSPQDVRDAQDQINTIVPGISKERTRAFGRFELQLLSDLTEAQQTTFSDWVAAEHPDWEVVWR